MLHTTGDPRHPLTRRAFLHHGLAFLPLATTAPGFIERAAHAMAPPEGSMLSSRPGVPEDRILVMVHLIGGNDGLNTVVPYGSGAYYRIRRGLTIPAPNAAGVAPDRRALDLEPDSGIGLHPGLAAFKNLLDDGKAAIVQGVGYPNPSRSHFTSIHIWQTADTGARGAGWIGRYLDHISAGAPDPQGAVSIGRTRPNGPCDSLMPTSLNGQVSPDRFRAALAQRPLVPYPRGPLAAQLRTVAALIRGESKMRICCAALGGFDTHTRQLDRHAGLLRQLGDALGAFAADLKAQGNSRRVLTMVFSEFGRRVKPNAAGGTDHGTAGPMFFIGDAVRPGLIGEHPSLTALDDGDLVFSVDFRCIYAAVLEDWMGADSAAILGREYAKAKIISA
jgi:uncharacterized protein (DUF1501 family)